MESGFSKRGNEGDASTSLINASADTKFAALAKGGGGEGVIVNAWVKKSRGYISGRQKKRCQWQRFFISTWPSVVLIPHPCAHSL